MFQRVMEKHDIASVADLEKLSSEIGAVRKQLVKSSIDEKEYRRKKRESAMRKMTIPFDKVEIYDKIMLGEGGSAKVYKGEYEGVDVAVKVFTIYGASLKDSVEVWKNISKEVAAMAGLSHPNIVRPYGAYQAMQANPPQMGLVMELMPGKSLRDTLVTFKNNGKTVPADLKVKWLLHVARGLHCIIKQGICHCDVKSTNMLFDANGCLKVTDFGLAATTTATSTYSSYTVVGGSTPWMSPEQLKDEGGATEASDVYAFGMVMWEMETCDYPWSYLSTFNKIYQAVAVRGERPPIPDSCVGECCELMKECWQQDAPKRPTFNAIVLRVEGIQKFEPEVAPPSFSPSPSLHIFFAFLVPSFT
jgi:serine/threonine protein kinase